MSASSPSASPWEPPHPEELQTMLPQYEISEIIGRGGMGAVYKGRQAKLNRTVAIKLLPETFTQGEDELNFAKRFEQEAQSMANLDHPAIISVHDFGETANGQLYFVMEFVDGMDVHQYLQHHGGKLPQESALSITAHVLDALDYAHSQGIAHRDIKPANILLNHEGRVKIADFGLAKKFGDAADKSAPALTISNVAVGTPDFVAPEALDSDQTPDHRADLYAVGVMLYQMLTGKLPRGNFKGPSELDGEIDPRLDEIVSQAMASDPDHRYQSAAAVRADLDLVLSQPLARVQAGERSGAVAAAVPLKTSVKGEKAVKTKSQMPMIVGIAAAAVLVVGLLVMATKKSSTGFQRGGPPPVASTGTKDGGVQPLIAPKPDPVPAKTPASEKPVASLSGAGPAAPATGDMAAATIDAPFKNSLGMKFVPVPGTDVLFCIHEVRYKDYAEYADTAKETVDGRWKGHNFDGFEIQKYAWDQPVASVSWEDAQKFCTWLSEKEGKTYRLPTDREWSLAVGIGQEEDWKDDTTPETVYKVPDAFPWGDEWPPPKGAGNYSDASRQAKAPRDDAKYVEGGYDDDFPTTAPVMSFEASKFGLFDLGGNVWEWCEDWYSDEQKERVLRGASWNDHERGGLLSSRRNRNTPDNQGNSRGFRVVLVVSPAPAPVSVAPAMSRPVPPPMVPDPALARATKDAPFENSLGMKFVPVPGTEVLFCIHEVRYRDYEEYAKRAKETVDGGWKTQTNDGFEIKKDAEDHPVTGVNWDDAQKFCAWLSEKEGKTYRLPTDREWSHAVGIGREEDWKADTTPANVFKPQDIFPWGDEWPPPSGVGNYSDASRQAKAPCDDAKYVDGYDDGFPTTAPVMNFEANKYGLFDLGGNVWEWCEDWFSDEQKERVLRGASWCDYERGPLLSSRRYRRTPEIRYNSNGFRVVVVPSASGR